MRRLVVPPHGRTGVVLRACGVLVSAVLVTAPVLLAAVGHGSTGSVCGPGGDVLSRMPGPVACSHADVAPPGVDVNEPVSTAELRSRVGAGPAAYEAAEDLGVPMAAASNATTPAVTCDGDGSSGFRVQAMYVVEAGHANRYASLLAGFKLWAAGVDDVINRSAAVTGGVRNVRYVTESAAGGTCEAKVLNVTVPAGSMSSFNATISAVQALGYTDPIRKYLMWTDGTGQCGIASLYPNDGATQANPNNGFYAQYARIDSACWGFGDGAGDHSVEAHELVHTLGAVNRSAAHSTANGHCWDESDTMCYADGGGHAMVQVCPPTLEYLLDCNSDDYFSTYPEPGSYLSGHWNAADSRFLVGGGDGSGGGSAGTPTHLGATIGVNNPAVPGLSTQVEVAPVLPTGRTVQSVAWKAGRADCMFADATAVQTTITCPAKASGSTTVTVTVTDSTAATKVVTSPLTFATGTARPVGLGLGLDGQQGAASVCTSATFPVKATVTDTATGQPVLGLAVAFTKKTSAMTVAAAAGAATTVTGGVATASGVAKLPTSYAARTTAGTVFAAGTSATVTATPAKCTLGLDAAASDDDVYQGDPVTVSGTLSRTVGGEDVGVAGVSVPVKLTWTEGSASKSLALGTVKTLTDGSFTAAVKPTRSGHLGVAVPAAASWSAVSADLGSLIVRTPTTELTGAADAAAVGYGGTVRVAGRLTRTAGTSTTGVGAASVTVKVLASGARAATTVGTARTLADGSYSLAVPLRL